MTRSRQDLDKLTDDSLYNQIREIHIQLSNDQDSHRPITKQQLDFLRAKTQEDVSSPAFDNLIACFKQLNDPLNAPLIEPYLYREDPAKAGPALSALCWLGQAPRLKPYLLQAVEPGFAWDPERKVSVDAFYGMGRYLSIHRDRDFAQMVLRWTTLNDDDLYRSLQQGASRGPLNHCRSAAEVSAGIAVGVDPADLVYDVDLIKRSVERFVPERQDG